MKSVQRLPVRGAQGAEVGIGDEAKRAAGFDEHGLLPDVDKLIVPDSDGDARGLQRPGKRRGAGGPW